MTLPLQGIRIIAVEQYGAGPFATQHLADLGAEVIKIENRDGGDFSRSTGPHFFGPGDSHFSQSFNRNKKSLTLDLKMPEGQEVLHDLVKGADAVFNNLRGDQPKKLGLTYERLKEFNPKVVCGHLSAYGRSGSRAAWPGFDYVMQAEAGYLSLSGEPDGPPARFGVSMVDFLTGATAGLGLLAGIIGARQTGVGRDVDVSLFDVALHSLTYLATWYLNEGATTTKQPRSAHPSATPCQLYRTRDGWIFIMCNKEKFWVTLTKLIDRPAWAEDPEFASFPSRLRNREKLTQMLDEVLMAASTAEWVAKFAGKVPSAPIYDLKQALDNEFVAERKMILDVPHPARGTIRLMSSPIRCSGEQDLTEPAPQLGADTEHLLHSMGYDDARIETLRRNKII